MHQFCEFKKLRDALYGEILLATEVDGRSKVAIKSLHRTCVDSKVPLNCDFQLSEDVYFEIDAMKALNANGGHHNVVKLQQTFDSNDGKKLNLVLEYQPGGELFDKIMDQGRLDGQTAKRYFADCVGGLLHIHKNGYVHRDLSLENCLIGEDDQIVITDFGLAAKHTGSETERVGKGFYIAPEVYAIEDGNGSTYDGTKSDVWSLGVILFMMLTGVPPSETPSHDDRRFCLIKAGRIEKMLRGWRMGHLFSEDALDLVQRMLCVDADKRISLLEIAEHAYVKELLEETEEKQPEQTHIERTEPEAEPENEEPNLQDCSATSPIKPSTIDIQQCKNAAICSILDDGAFILRELANAA